MTPRHVLAISALALAVAGGLAWGAQADPGMGGVVQATPGTGKIGITVPQAKLVRAAELYHREKRRADRLEAVVRHSPTVREALDIASIVYGVPRREIEAVAFCESRLDPRARNRTPIYNGEHATGLMQTIPSTFARSPYRHLSIYSAYSNALAGAYIWSLSRSWREWACRP